MFTLTIRGSGLIGVVVLAAVICLAAAPVSAAPRVAFSQLIPAAPATIANNSGNGSCASAESPARMTSSYRVQWPEIALEQGVAPTAATVLLNLDANGKLVGESLAKSSGNRLLDNEALHAVQASQYAAEIRDCDQIAGSYFVGVMFLQSDDRATPLFAIPGGGGSSTPVKY